MAKITMSRKQLYERVWATPASTLAKEFGFSDVALAKLCRKYDIPKPPLGYWAKVQHGHEVAARPRLPKTMPTNLVIEIGKREAIGLVVASQYPKIVVSISTDAVHPLVQQTRDQLHANRADATGLRWRTPNKGLDVAVGEQSIDRGLRIMDSIVKALQGQGHTIAVVQTDKGGRTVANVSSEEIDLQLRETLSWRSVTPAVVKRSLMFPSASYSPGSEQHPSGELRLSLKTEHGKGFQREWSDHRDRPLERQLSAFLAGICRAAAASKVAREEYEQRARENLERQRIEEERQRRVHEEQARIEALKSHFDAWKRCNELRAFVADVERRAKAEGHTLDPATDLGQWCRWAQELIRKNDPIRTILGGKRAERSSSFPHDTLIDQDDHYSPYNYFSRRWGR